MGEGSPGELDPTIAGYYDRTPEESRLQQGPFRLEEARTRELIERFAPPPPAVSWTSAEPRVRTPCGLSSEVTRSTW